MHTGELPFAPGADGIPFTTTPTVSVVVEPHPGTVTIKEYVPPALIVALEIVGFCCEEENPFGPVQLYIPAVMLFDVN